MNRLLLVDGSNLLFQMFFGMPARIVNAQGKPIQGTLGFVGALLKIIRMTQPTHIAVLFDGEHANARVEINAAYKANRTDYSQTPAENTPFSQLNDVYAALDFMGIRHAETTTCETDDWMAAYVIRCAQDTEIVISSFDSDFFQLISDRVSVLRYRGAKTTICTPAYIREKFAVAPSQYADLKALTGDPSDNIRGIEKVGPKTAAALLNQFGTLDSILANSHEISRPSLRSAILQSAERLRQNQKLIRLTCTAPLPFLLNELHYSSQGFTTNEILQGIRLR